MQVVQGVQGVQVVQGSWVSWVSWVTTHKERIRVFRFTMNNAIS